MYRLGIDDRAFRDILGCRPMPLHDGYYTGCNIWYAPPEYAAYKTAYLTITLDEVEGNDSIYHEWRYHWENLPSMNRKLLRSNCPVGAFF